MCKKKLINFFDLTLKAIKNIIEGKTMLKQTMSNTYFKQRKDNDALINFDQPI